MLLPTMNDEEKTYEAFRVTRWLCDVYEEWQPTIGDKFMRGTRFPYIQRGSVKDDKNNEWSFVFLCPTKDRKRKCVRYYTMAYTTYDIPRKRIEKDVNAGRGCLMFDPIAMRRMIDGGERCAAVMDIVPHAFNRYTERYLKPHGMENISFGRKLENMLMRWQWFDILAGVSGDKSAAKYTDGNICPYDVMMRGGGMLRGQIVNDLLIRFFTYVSDDMLFDSQKQRQAEIVSEYYHLKNEGVFKRAADD